MLESPSLSRMERDRWAMSSSGLGRDAPEIEIGVGQLVVILIVSKSQCMRLLQLYDLHRLQSTVCWVLLPTHGFPIPIPLIANEGRAVETRRPSVVASAPSESQSAHKGCGSCIPDHAV